MHVTSKEVDENGVHILSSTVEADGPFELAKPDATVAAEVIAVRRTDSGGVFVQVALKIDNPTPKAPEAPPTPESVAVAYLVTKGLSEGEAKEAVSRFGVARIHDRIAADHKEKSEALDSELDALLKK